MEDSQEQEFEAFRNIPKVELHAHLNGSISKNSMEKLYALKHKDSLKDHIIPHLGSARNLSECFEQFKAIHDLTDSLEAVHMSTCDVIREFAADQVRYLELRTTPKEVENSMNQESYIMTVLDAIKKTVAELENKIIVKLLLSVDRSRNFQHAEETIKIAQKYFVSSQAVVGIDFSGNPSVGNFSTFLPLLEHAKQIGLKLSVHTSEVPDVDEEVKQILKLGPDRLGHGTFLHPNKGGSVQNFSILNQMKLPLEICLTSNVISKTVSSYEDHHFQLFKEMNYPCLLCTDDKGIFNTSLSKEYYFASQYYALTKEDLYDMSYNSIDFVFSPDCIKKELREMWWQSNKQFIS